MADLTALANEARPISVGGTGGTSASGARTNLGLAIGSDVQAYSANLASLSGLTFAADKGLYTTGANTAALYDLTAYGRTLAGLANAAALRSNINVEDGATADQTAAEIAAMEQDWRGGGSETLIAATAALQSLTGSVGNGQTWQSFSIPSERTHSTSYQNTTGQAIAVGLACNSSDGTIRDLQVSTDNATWVTVGKTSNAGSPFTIVPDQHYYRINGATNIDAWAELR